ncbi:hypothetical protein SADUNF_Sadunf05G0177100 [Salix dunnii]|uniref:Uncharacterized protein n=1 Tax=Salix dunnii TaxID=1413687 RepID=A0A835KBW5_9ROSI|nr:hypothetical protein SADUNF_Sadunf05G0177100 [Salix dunnii]
MEIRTRSKSLFALLFLAMAAVELRGDEGTNSNAGHNKVNVTFLDHARPQGSQNKTSNTEAVVNYNKNSYVFSNEDYKLGEFAQCTVIGRCKGMRLDCPLHCGGPCFYDCQHMCKAHCRRR